MKLKKLSDHEITIQEIFSFEPFLNSDCLAGWSGKDHAIHKIAEMGQTEKLKKANLSDYPENLFVTVDLRLFSFRDLIADLKQHPLLKGILLFGTPRPELKTQDLEFFEENKMPLLYSSLEDAHTQLTELLELLTGMKKSNRFRHFAQSTIYCYLKEKEYSELVAFLKQKTNQDIQGEVQVLQPGCSDEQADEAGEGNCTLSLMDQIYLETGNKILLEQAVQKQNLDNIEKKYKLDFMHDLLFGNFESKEDMINRGRYWGFDLTLPHQLLVIEPHTPGKSSNPAEFLDKIQYFSCEALGCSQCQSMVGQIQDQVVLIVPEKFFKDKTINKENAFSLAGNLHKNLRKHLPNVSFAMGIGRCYSSILDLSRSFQEGKLSLELGKLIYDKNHISHFDDLGVVRLLASIDFLQLDDFYKEYLGELMAYDQQNETCLLDTLFHYFKYNGDVNAVAQKMYIHPNSLRNRLRKIEELTHTDLKDYEDLLNLSIACKIATMKQSSS